MSSDETTWGVQPNGFVTPTYSDLFDNLASNLRSYVDPDIDLDADAPEGQQVGVYCRQSAKAWEALQIGHDSNNPDNAEDDQLQDLAKLSGTAIEGPSPTTVAAQVELAAGTTLQHGVAFAYPNGHPEQLFTILQDFTAPYDGTFTRVFIASTTGSISVPAHALRNIAGPITGWTSINNSAAGVSGSTGDTNETLRLRMGTDLARAGSTSAAALEADIDALPEVISVTVLENLTDYTDGDGLAPHSCEAVVYASGTLDTELLAKTIWEGKPAGIKPQGTTEISYTDAQGVLRRVDYTPVTTQRIYLHLGLVASTGYPGAAVIKSDVATALTAKAKPGVTFAILQAVKAALLEPGVEDCTSYLSSTDGVTYSPSNVAVGVRQIATFAAGDILVTP